MVHALSFEAFHFAIQGWAHNSAIRFHQSNEATARQGVNRVLTTLFQLAQFLVLSEQISLLEGLKHAAYLPSFLKKTVYFSIPLVGGARYLLNFTQDYPKLKNIVKN